MFLLFSLNFFCLINKPILTDGFKEKKEVVEYIGNHAKNSGYPCIAINYITRQGANVGFRYLFWQNNTKLIKAGNNVPIYNIVTPWTTSLGEINTKFGSIGIILPERTDPPKTATCNDPQNQLLPLLGFNN